MAHRRGTWSIRRLIGLTSDPDPAGTLASSDDVDARLRAARDLGQRGGERAVGPLLEAVASEYGPEHGPVAEAAVVALAHLDKQGHEITPEALLEVIGRIRWGQLTGGAQNTIKLTLVSILARHATAAHIPALIGYLHVPPSSDQADIACDVLARLDDPAAVTALAAELRQTFAPDTRREILGKLCRSGRADVLLELFTNASLLLPDSTGTSDHLFDAVSMRARIAEALGRQGERRAIQPLLDWLDEIRATLSSLAPPQRNEHGHLLGNSPEHAYERAQEAVATSLGRIGGPEVVEAMLTRLAAGDEIAAAILGDCGDTRAVPALITCLQEHGWASAAVALGKLGDRRAVPALCARLKKVTNGYESNILQVDLAQALVRIGDRSALPALEAIDLGPVTTSDRAMARDDGTLSIYLNNREEIHQAVIAMGKSRRRLTG